MKKIIYIMILLYILMIPFEVFANDSLLLNKYKNAKQYHRQKYLYEHRQHYSKSRIINLYQELYKAKSYPQLLGSEKWEALGPFKKHASSQHEYDGSGRINSIAIDPNDPTIIYVGSASGGIWKTTNRGSDWESLDMTNFMSIGISDIEIAPFKKNIIYAATGDIANLYTPPYSIGILKSSDSGKTWNVLNDDILLSDSLLISEMVIDPIDQSFLTVATNKGILRTSDGGISWGKIYGDDNTFIRDIELQPSNPYTIYASTFDWQGNAEIIISTDDGYTWETFKVFPNSCRVELAVSNANPALLYILSAKKNNNYSCDEFLIYNQLNNEWIELSKKTSEGEDIVYSQGHYNLLLEVNPEDENEIFAGGVYLYHSTDRGETWFEKVDDIHVDNHDFLFALAGYKYSANDGGIYYSKNNDNFESLNEGLNITQFYKLAVNPRNPDITYAGSQDNGTKLYINDTWEHIFTADGMETCIDPIDNAIVYLSKQRGDVYRSSNFGYFPQDYITSSLSNYETPWLAEISTHPTKADEIYLAYKQLFKSTNKGDNWQIIAEAQPEDDFITALLIDTNTIYYGNNKHLYKLEGQELSKIADVENSISDVIRNKDCLFYSLTGFDSLNKVFQYRNEEIENITANIPNIPINCLEFIEDENLLLAGTDMGVFATNRDEINWAILGDGLPHVIVTELDYNNLNNIVKASTFGSGLWQIIYPIEEMEKPTLNISGAQTICETENLELFITNYDSSLFYIWQDGSTNPKITANKQQLYYITAIDTNRNIAKSSDIVELTQVATPKPKIYLESNNPICPEDYCILRCELPNNDLNQFDIMWSNGDTTQKVYVNKAGVYFVKGENIDGCIGYSDSIDVIIHETSAIPMITREGNFLISTQADQYQWYHNDVKINEAVGKKYYATKRGKYSVYIKDINRCSAKSEYYYLEIPEDDIVVSPNPSSGIIWVEGFSEETSSIKIEIFDLLGRRYKLKELTNIEGFFSQQIDISEVSIGIYLINITIGDKQHKRKIEKN